MRVIEAHVHIGCHPLRLDRVCHQPTLAGIKEAALPSDPERLDLPSIPAPSRRYRGISVDRPGSPSYAAGPCESRLNPRVSGGPPAGVSPHLADPPLTNPHHAMLTGVRPVGLPPVMPGPIAIFMSTLGYVGLGAVEPRFSSGAVRFRLAGWQSVGGHGVCTPIRLLCGRVGCPCKRAMNQRLQ